MTTKRLFRTMLDYDVQGATEAGTSGHPQQVVGALAEKHGFRVIQAEPFIASGGWRFWIERTKSLDWLPSWLTVENWQ